MRLERDPAFWVATGVEGDWPLLTGSPVCLPLACEHGGFIFVRLDALGRVLDLHAAFKPSGWGRVANHHLKACLAHLVGWDLITATEVEGNWRSRPPKSFGFRPAGPVAAGFRTWVLTRAGWEASPARRRME